MTKQQLFDAFGGKISKSAIRRVDDEYRVVGKFCYVAPQDGQWDVWICNTKDIRAGLGTEAVNNRVRAIFSPNKTPVVVGDGEAWGCVPDTDTILQNLKLLGIRKKREGGDVSSLRHN